MINDEYKNNNIPHNSTIFSDLETNDGIPENSLPLILGKIKNFEKSSS